MDVIENITGQTRACLTVKASLTLHAYTLGMSSIKELLFYIYHLITFGMGYLNFKYGNAFHLYAQIIVVYKMRKDSGTI